MSGPSCSTCRFQGRTDVSESLVRCHHPRFKSDLGPPSCLYERRMSRPGKLWRFFGMDDVCGPEGRYHAARRPASLTLEQTR